MRIWILCYLKILWILCSYVDVRFGSVGVILPQNAWAAAHGHKRPLMRGKFGSGLRAKAEQLLTHNPSLERFKFRWPGQDEFIVAF